MAEHFPKGLCWFASNWQISVSSYTLQLFPVSGNKAGKTHLRVEPSSPKLKYVGKTI